MKLGIWIKVEISIAFQTCVEIGKLSRQFSTICEISEAGDQSATAAEVFVPRPFGEIVYRGLLFVHESEHECARSGRHRFGIPLKLCGVRLLRVAGLPGGSEVGEMVQIERDKA